MLEYDILIVGAVLGYVRQSGVNSTLGGTGVGPHGVYL